MSSTNVIHCLVCKKPLTKTANINLAKGGKIIRLCSFECKLEFDKDSSKYLQ